MRRAAVPAGLCSMLAAAALAGCGGGSAERGRDLTAVATTTQVADLVANVGGSRVEVRRLLRPGADPHAYEPRPSDVRAVADAALVFESGGDVDGWLDEVIAGAGGHAREVVLLDSVRPLRSGGEVDPHWWQDPRAAIAAVRAIRAALTRADPEGGRGYARRAAAYSGRLRRLDRAIARCFASVPPERRAVVTSHDALGYLTRRYRIRRAGSVIPSLSTSAQPSARDVERLVELIRAEGVRAVFPESALDPRLEEAIAREAGVEVGPALWADSLGPEGSGAATYLGATAASARALARGMGASSAACARLGRG
jgi:ABC-type Zn uptake system ZnuABC Zn-binding protein ZnuA